MSAFSEAIHKLLQGQGYGLGFSKDSVHDELNKLVDTIYVNQSYADGINIVLGTTTGTQIGTGVTQKMGFYGAAPIAQRAGAAQAAVVTTGSTQTSPFGYATAGQADAIVTLVNELRAALVALGFVKGAA